MPMEIMIYTCRKKTVLDAIDDSRSIQQIIDQVKSIHPANRHLEMKQMHILIVEL